MIIKLLKNLRIKDQHYERGSIIDAPIINAKEAITTKRAEYAGLINLITNKNKIIYKINKIDKVIEAT